MKNGARDKWVGRIESCLSEHLAAWGLGAERRSYNGTLPSGHTVEEAHIEPAYKGNYHLMATIDGKEYKYVIRKGTKEHEEISSTGLSEMTEERLKDLVERYLGTKLS